MKPIKLDILFEAARQETAPAVDVTDSVLVQLSEQRRSVIATVNRSLMWFSMTASTVAAGILLAAFLSLRQQANAVNEIINWVAWVAQ